MVIFDPQSALQRVMNDKELLAELLEIYIQEAPSLLARIREAVIAKNPDGIKKTAHALKGASLNCSALEVSELAYSLEKLGMSGSADHADELFFQLEKASEQLLNALLKHIQELRNT